jgi:bifunctional DNA-binding transcriptional regulator/antitoxin component of YhaV-PrlF toxin-antitoxin module
MAAKGAAKLSAKFQICIPKAIRTARRWQAGQVFACIPKGEGMLLVPVPQPEELFGLARSLRIVEYDGRRVPYASDAEMATARASHGTTPPSRWCCRQCRRRRVRQVGWGGDPSGMNLTARFRSPSKPDAD